MERRRAFQSHVRRQLHRGTPAHLEAATAGQIANGAPVFAALVLLLLGHTKVLVATLPLFILPALAPLVVQRSYAIIGEEGIGVDRASAGDSSAGPRS